MRLIDGDKLIRKYIDTDIEKFSDSDVKIVLENLKQNILKAPSIDIVRCKECKYCVPYSTCNGDYQMCMRWEDYSCDVNLNDFCSWGEREGE